jgi:ParB-like chromosome segregation protein Spo0J
METRKFKIDELAEAEYNPRATLTESDEEFQDLRYSIENFGYVTPIIVNGRTNTVIGGHQRLNVLKSLGYTEIDCVVLDIDGDSEKLLNVALNKIDGEWDYGELGELLREMQSADADMQLTGFSPAEMEDIIGGIAYDDEAEPDGGGGDDGEAEQDDEIDCRIGEFEFTMTQNEFENIIIGIKLSLGSQKQVIESELSRRLLCSKR